MENELFPALPEHAAFSCCPAGLGLWMSPLEFPCLVLSGGFLEVQLISSKSSSCSCLRNVATLDKAQPSSGFVHTGTEGQLYLGRVFSWASVCCCWASRRCFFFISILMEMLVRNRVRNGWTFLGFAVSLMCNPNVGIPLPGVLLLFVNTFFFFTGGNWSTILNTVFKHLSACLEPNPLGT